MRISRLRAVGWGYKVIILVINNLVNTSFESKRKRGGGKGMISFLLSHLLRKIRFPTSF